MRKWYKKIKKLFRKFSGFFIAWFPVIIVSAQVLVNLSSFIVPEWYLKEAFYLNWSVGTNGLFAFFFIMYTFRLRFCSISKACAVAEMAFAIWYLWRQQDDVDNIGFQIIVGTVALLWTFKHYIKKFPKCDLSRGVRFFWKFINTCSCSKTIDHFDQHSRHEFIRDYHETNP